MKSNARKTIAQKKKNFSLLNRNKSAKKRRTLLKNRLRLKKEDVARICCRCEFRFKENEHVMGGLYNGVVCLNHRSCVGCWFDKTARGARMFESAKTKSIPLVDKPFKGSTPLCPGCKKGLPPYELKPTPTSFSVGDDGVVYIDDSSDSD